MGIRETINEKPGIVITVTSIVVVVVLILGLYSSGLIGRPAPSFDGTGVPAFISDGGDEYRKGSRDEMYTTNEDGEPRAVAHVYRYPDGEPFVYYFERLHPKALEDYNALDRDDPSEQMEREMILASGTEVRRPGSDRWVPSSSDEGAAIAGPGPINEAGQEAILVQP